MRSLLLILVFIIIAASCRPSYTCTCYYNGFRDTSLYFGRIDINRARSQCNAFDSSLNRLDSCNVVGISVK